MGLAHYYIDYWLSGTTYTLKHLLAYSHPVDTQWNGHNLHSHSCLSGSSCSANKHEQNLGYSSSLYSGASLQGRGTIVLFSEVTNVVLISLQEVVLFSERVTDLVLATIT